jgi:hypothetical protein
VNLDGEAPSRAGAKRHSLRLAGINRDFDVVAVKVENAPAVGGPNEFDRITSMHLERLRRGFGESAVFNAQFEAARFFAGALSFADFARSDKGCHRNHGRQPQADNLIAVCDAAPHTLFSHIPMAANSLDYP